MAYQPIQMPRPEGLGGFAEFLVGLARDKQQEEARKAELLLRQKDMEDQAQHRRALEANASAELAMQQENNRASVAQKKLAALREITGAIDAGRPDYARQVAQAYGIKINESPKLGPGDALAAMPREVPAEAPQPPPDLDLDKADDKNAVQAHEAAIGDYKARLANYHPGEMREESGGFYVPRGGKYEIDGQWYDPEQTRMAAEQRHRREADQVRAAFGPLGYGDEAGALALANTQDKPIDISGLISKRMERDTQRAATETAKEEQRNFQREENAKWRNEGLTRDDRFALAEINAQGKERAAKAYAESPTKVDSAARQDRAFLDKAMGGIDKNTNLSKLVMSWDQINAAEGNIKSNEPLAHLDATLQLARAVRGQVTEGEMHLLYSKLGGYIDKPQQFMAALENGDLSGYQREQVAAAIGIVKEHIQHRIDQQYQAYKALGSDPAMRNLAPSFNAAVRSRFAPFGRQVPDAMDEKAAGAAPVIGGARERAGSQSAPSRPVAGPPTGTVAGSPEDVNSEAPLPEDPNAESLPPPNKLVAAAKAKKGQQARGAATLRGTTVTEATVRERARMAGSDPDKAVARARQLGLIP